MTLSYDLLFFSDKKKEVIFKRLSLKALSALQDQEERGGRDNKNNYTNVSLRLYIIIHQYINAQSHPLHTLSKWWGGEGGVAEIDASWVARDWNKGQWRCNAYIHARCAYVHSYITHAQILKVQHAAAQAPEH